MDWNISNHTCKVSPGTGDIYGIFIYIWSKNLDVEGGLVALHWFCQQNRWRIYLFNCWAGTHPTAQKELRILLSDRQQLWQNFFAKFIKSLGIPKETGNSYQQFAVKEMGFWLVGREVFRYSSRLLIWNTPILRWILRSREPHLYSVKSTPVSWRRRGRSLCITSSSSENGGPLRNTEAYGCSIYLSIS